MLSGCGLYDKEYVKISDYSAPLSEGLQDDRISNSSQLRTCILNLVYNGEKEGKAVFSDEYEGDVANDLSLIISQVKRQDALCAYCVESIDYSLSHIVSYDEAGLSITYSDTGVSVDKVVQIPYAIGFDRYILNSFSDCSRKLVLLINRTAYSATDMKDKIEDIYCSNPGFCPCTPDISVSLFSGNSNQKLYEIEFDYGMDQSEIVKKRAEMKSVCVSYYEDDDDYARIDKISTYLTNSCEYSPDSGHSSIYDALVMNNADSEGIALAVVELCDRAGIESCIVHGQKNRVDCCWNIVKVGTDYFHVDIPACILYGKDAGFLKSDTFMWNAYRWDTSAYPACSVNSEIDVNG